MMIRTSILISSLFAYCLLRMIVANMLLLLNFVCNESYCYESDFYQHLCLLLPRLCLLMIITVQPCVAQECPAGCMCTHSLGSGHGCAQACKPGGHVVSLLLSTVMHQCLCHPPTHAHTQAQMHTSCSLSTQHDWGVSTHVYAPHKVHPVNPNPPCLGFEAWRVHAAATSFGCYFCLKSSFPFHRCAAE